jgi:hypothetical protein
MPGTIVHLGATVLCTHAGQATPVAINARVLVNGMPVATLASPYVVAGCALTGTPVPPCVTAQWITGATRVLAAGVPVLLNLGQSVCVPTGTPLLVVATQTRVTGI